GELTDGEGRMPGGLFWSAQIAACVRFCTWIFRNIDFRWSLTVDSAIRQLRAMILLESPDARQLRISSSRPESVGRVAPLLPLLPLKPLPPPRGGLSSDVAEFSPDCTSSIDPHFSPTTTSVCPRKASSRDFSRTSRDWIFKMYASAPLRKICGILTPVG